MVFEQDIERREGRDRYDQFPPGCSDATRARAPESNLHTVHAVGALRQTHPIAGLA